MVNKHKVFPQEHVLKELLDKHRNTLLSLRQVEALLKERFLKMDDAIEALILSVLSGEPLLLVGPPGTAKSRVIREFCRYVGIKPENSDLNFFGYLLTPFTEPNELFGFYKLVTKPDKTQELERITDNMMQKARVVFLDEVFNASSAILNSLLTFMNERKFYDRDASEDVAMQCLFGATNFTPQRERRQELSAVFDRFLLRAFVENVQVNSSEDLHDLSNLMVSGWKETYGRLDSRDIRDLSSDVSVNGNRDPQEEFVDDKLLDDIRQFQIDIKLYTRDFSKDFLPDAKSTFFTDLRGVVRLLRQYEYSDMSNRRLIKMLYVMLVHVLYHAAATEDSQVDFRMGQEQIQLLRFAVDHWNDYLMQALIAEGV